MMYNPHMDVWKEDYVELIVELQSILESVQKRFIWESDSKVWAKQDHWESAEETISATDKDGVVHGDCDQHAIMCRQALRARGIPNRFVLCLTELGECHLVVEVDGWILDNRYPRVMEKDILNYKWLSISGYRKGDAWHLIKA